MSRWTQAVLVGLVGAVLLRLATGDAVLRYVRPNARLWIVLAGVVLVGLAAAAVARPRCIDAGHDHVQRPSRAAWLGLVPVVILMITAPAPLGAYTANRHPPAVTPTSGAFDPLPATGVASLSVLEFVLRASDDAGRTLRGHRVTLVGFVARAEAGGFVLARLTITCCAADAVPVEVHVRAVTAPHHDDWVDVTGTFTGTGTDHTPRLRAATVSSVPAPGNPYQS